LGGAILKLLDDPGMLASFSRRARESVVAHFGAEGRVAALEDCYDEAIRLTDSAPTEPEPEA
jgi:hypothetical protein